MHYSVQPRDWTFVKSYEFLSFVKSMGKNNGKNISKNLSGKYSHTPLDHAEQSATDAITTTSSKVIKKKTTAKATVDLISNIIANRITKVSRTSTQNNLETIINKHNQ